MLAGMTGGIVGHRIALHPRPDVQRREKGQAARRRPPDEQRGKVFGPVDVQPGLVRREHASPRCRHRARPTVTAEAVRSEARADRIAGLQASEVRCRRRGWRERARPRAGARCGRSDRRVPMMTATECRIGTTIMPVSRCADRKLIAVRTAALRSNAGSSSTMAPPAARCRPAVSSAVTTRIPDSLRAGGEDVEHIPQHQARELAHARPAQHRR